MNCQDIATLLDDRDIAGLSAAERRQADAHLASCSQCASEWEAHARVLAAAVPPLPSHVAQRCRRLVSDGAGPRTERLRRAGLLAGLLVVGAAAAALGTQWIGDFTGAPSGQTTAGAGVERENELEAPVSAAAGDAPDTRNDAGAGPAATADAAASAAPISASAVSAVSSSGFTVAVPPLEHMSTHADVMAVTDAIYAAMLDELRKVPSLELVELASPLGPLERSVAFVAPDGSTSDMTLDAEVFDVTSVDTRTPGVEIGANLEIFAVRGRYADVSVTEEPAPVSVQALAPGDAVADETATSVVNVILRTDGAQAGSGARADTLDPDAGARAAEPAYDYVVSVTSSAGVDAASGRPQSFSYFVRGSKRGDPGAQATLVMSGNLYERVDVARFAREAVAELRKTLFAPDETLLEQIRARVLDASATIEQRLKALSELQIIANRSEGMDGRKGPIVAAAVDMAGRASSPEQRARVWRLMHGAQDPGLVQPLADALLYDAADTVRLAAAKALAPLADDPTARAALDQATGFDASADVRMQAKWSSLNDAGRRDYIASTLRDTSLSDAARLEPLLFSLGSLDTWSAGPQSGPVVAADAAGALMDIMRRSDDADVRAGLMSQLNGIDAPDVLAFRIERLGNDVSERVRAGAAAGLRDRLEAPGVRAALERAAETDSSRLVRDLAARLLDGQAGAALVLDVPAVTR